jgi:glycerate 2-kinase
MLLRALDAHLFSPEQKFNVIAAGKAGPGMAEAFMERHGARTRALLVARGGHPLPDAESFAAGARALALADENRARGDTLVVLLSGGASAMLAAPAEGVTLDRKIAVTRDLLRSGRPIAEMNAVRKQLSAIKGGKLAARAGRSITFAISDVHAPIEDDPSVIGSGPTVLDAPLPGVDALFVLVGSRRDAMQGARESAERLGYAVRVIDAPVLGEARDAPRGIVLPPTGGRGVGGEPFCVIASGETTVTLPADGTHGRGGRNQELALAFAMQPSLPEEYAFASAGTDGVDGPTDAAGAIVDGTTLARAREKGLDAAAALQAHNSYAFFEALGDLVITGPTGTNVGDLQIFLSLSRPT